MHSILLPKQYPFCVFQKRRRFKKVLGCEAECIFVVGIWCCSIRCLAYSLPKLLINDGSEYKLMYLNWFRIYVYVPEYIAFQADFEKLFFRNWLRLSPIFCVLPWLYRAAGPITTTDSNNNMTEHPCYKGGFNNMFIRNFCC